VSGCYVDLMHKGELPYAVVLAIVVYSGLNAALWIIVRATFPKA